MGTARQGSSGSIRSPATLGLGFHGIHGILLEILKSSRAAAGRGRGASTGGGAAAVLVRLLLLLEELRDGLDELVAGEGATEAADAQGDGGASKRQHGTIQVQQRLQCGLGWHGDDKGSGAVLGHTERGLTCELC